MTRDALIGIVVAAAVGAGFTFILTWFKARREEVHAQADEFAAAIIDAADLASNYWLSPHDANGLKLMEARLLGAQQRLSLLSKIAFETFPRFDRELLEKEDLPDFFDACTGGQFGVRGRPMDTGRAVEVQATAAHVTYRVRRAFLTSVSFRGYLFRMFPFLD